MGDIYKICQTGLLANPQTILLTKSTQNKGHTYVFSSPSLPFLGGREGEDLFYILFYFQAFKKCFVEVFYPCFIGVLC